MPVLSDEPSTSELDRRFDRLEESIDRGFIRINEQLNRMVTQDVFALFQRAIEQRVAAVETDVAKLDQQTDDDRQQLQAAINAVETARAADRRNMVKVVVTFAVGILGVIATLASILLPFVLGGP